MMTEPGITLKTDDGEDFELQSRKGKWTVLYFYPKAETPGCTKQACAFRDGIVQIRMQGAEIFGISADDVNALKKFKANHSLNFTLLADPDLDAINGIFVPYLLIASRSGSASSVKLRLWFALNFRRASTSSALMPKSSAPSMRICAMPSLKAQACFVQPGVSALG